MDPSSNSFSTFSASCLTGIPRDPIEVFKQEFHLSEIQAVKAEKLPLHLLTINSALPPLAHALVALADFFLNAFIEPCEVHQFAQESFDKR